jgi:hypothetical protein
LQIARVEHDIGECRLCEMNLSILLRIQVLVDKFRICFQLSADRQPPATFAGDLF